MPRPDRLFRTRGGTARYYANAHHRDVLDIVSHPMRVESARDLNADIDREGFTLARHDSAVSDWRDPAQIAGVYAPELAALVSASPGRTRSKCRLRHPALSEKSGLAGSGNNSHPARFAHIDVADGSSRMMAKRGAGGRPFAAMPRSTSGALSPRRRTCPSPCAMRAAWRRGPDRGRCDFRRARWPRMGL
jgi:hypothetical protein